MEDTIQMVLFFLIVVGIPVIASAWGKAQKGRMRLAERQLELTGSETAEKAAQYASRVAELEQRVRVLERIVTDGGVQTAAQIEALRDAPSIFAEQRERVR